MRFRRTDREEPEINLIPFIDVLLVVVIFLMLSTTYSKFTEMQLRLPSADADIMKDRPKEIIVSIGADGRYVVGKTLVSDRSALAVAQALQALDIKDPIVIINADATSTHQSVVTVMEAARRVGFNQITFATQTSSR
jgi:biopolymer transport protein ExbD